MVLLREFLQKVYTLGFITSKEHRMGIDRGYKLPFQSDSE